QRAYAYQRASLDVARAPETTTPATTCRRAELSTQMQARGVTYPSLPAIVPRLSPRSSSTTTAGAVWSSSMAAATAMPTASIRSLNAMKPAIQTHSNLNHASNETGADAARCPPRVRWVASAQPSLNFSGPTPSRPVPELARGRGDRRPNGTSLRAGAGHGGRALRPARSPPPARRHAGTPPLAVGA